MNNAEKGMEFFFIYTECLNSKAIQHVNNMIIRKNRIYLSKIYFQKYQINSFIFFIINKKILYFSDLLDFLSCITLWIVLTLQSFFASTIPFFSFKK